MFHVLSDGITSISSLVKIGQWVNILKGLTDIRANISFFLPLRWRYRRVLTTCCKSIIQEIHHSQRIIWKHLYSQSPQIRVFSIFNFRISINTDHSFSGYFVSSTAHIPGIQWFQYVIRFILVTPVSTSIDYWLRLAHGQICFVCSRCQVVAPAGRRPF
jgi:hypothetical protein